MIRELPPADYTEDQYKAEIGALSAFIKSRPFYAKDVPEGCIDVHRLCPILGCYIGGAIRQVQAADPIHAYVLKQALMQLLSEDM